MIGPLRRRSSWPSSFVTGLIGWNGFSVVAALLLGYSGPGRDLFGVATALAVAQVLVTRLLFGALRLDRSVWIGVVWGGVIGGVLWAIAWNFSPLLHEHTIASLLTALYIGPPVGAFLSYFHRDDRKIEREAAAAGVAVEYGRDAHWLDPFAYGAAAYLLSFFARSVDIAVYSAVVGAVVGVVAAGVSHFFLSRFGNSLATVPAAAVVGAGVGAISGFLFRNYQQLLWLPCFAQGALAGALTFAVTALHGRSLARREIASMANPAKPS